MNIGSNDPGDRKQVTVLFADIVRSSDIVRKHDSEVAEGVFNQVISRQIAIVEKAGGTVNQVMGDGIMCLFGAEAPFEEHALRAVTAAQEMLKSAEDVQRMFAHIPLQVRIGINTGEVVLVRRGKDRYGAAFQATGETVHIADRVMKQAEPGHMAVSAAARSFLDRYYSFKKTTSFHWHAEAELMDVFEPTAPKKPAPAVQPSIHRAAFSARIEALLSVMEKRQEPKIIWLRGHAGIGKTHLVDHYIRNRFEACIHVNFYPDPLSNDAGSLIRVLDRGDVDGAVRRLLAVQKPTLLILEDVHWAKEDELSCIERLFDLCEGHERLYIVATSRQKAPFHATKVKDVLLEGMTAKEGVQLLRMLDDGFPQKLRGRIYALSGGNPYFIHEYFNGAQAMLARGETVACVSRSLGQYTPGLVADMIYNKLSGAGDALIRIAKVAAVVGMRVPFNILSALYGGERKALLAALKKLEEADILKQNRIFPEPEWVFTHELLQKVIYQAIPKRTRAAWHGEVVVQMKKSLFKAMDGRHALMAMHAEKSGNALQRHIYLKWAARGEMVASRHGAAVQMSAASRKALAALPQARRFERRDMQLRLLEVSGLFILGQYARAAKHLSALLSRKPALKKYGFLEQALSYQELYFWIKGDLPGAARMAKAILSLPSVTKGGAVYIREHSRLGNIYIDLGRFRDAIAHDKNVVGAISDRDAHKKFDLLAEAKPASLASLALAYAALGEAGKSRQYFSRAYDFADKSADDFTRIFIFTYLAHSLIVQRREAEAQGILKTALALCEKTGSAILKPYALSASGIAHARTGRAKEGLALCREALILAAKNKLVVRSQQFEKWHAEAARAAKKKKRAYAKA